MKPLKSKIEQFKMQRIYNKTAEIPPKFNMQLTTIFQAVSNIRRFHIYRNGCSPLSWSTDLAEHLFRSDDAAAARRGTGSAGEAAPWPCSKADALRWERALAMPCNMTKEHRVGGLGGIAGAPCGAPTCDL